MQSALFKPFATDVKIPIEKSTLTSLQRALIYQAAQFWLDDKKQSKNSWFYPPVSSLVLPFKLDYSIIKIEGQVYILHHGLLDKGGFGKVKYLENLRTGEISVVKISDSVYAIQEIKVLLDLGLLRGSAVRVSFPFPGTLDARRKIYIVMPFLGKSLRAHLKENEHNLDSLKDETRTFLGSLLAKTYGDLHRGIPFISGLGHTQRDAKPNNVILNSKGYVIIDHGATKPHPKSQRIICTGTYPYVPKIVTGRVQNMDYSPVTRSGEFIDMAAVQGMLNSELLYSSSFRPSLNDKYLGLFNAEYIRKHNLRRYIVPAYELSIGYINESDFPAKDGWAFAAYIIASKILYAKTEMLERIFSDEDLALCILAEYFTSPESWVLISDFKILEIFAYSRKQLREKAVLVKYDLIAELSQALKNVLLMRILQSDVEHDYKRVAACLFKRNMLTQSNYSFIVNNENLVLLYIEAHKYDDIETIRDIILGKHNYTIGYLQYRKSRYFVRNRRNNSAVFESGNELTRAESLLRGFEVSDAARIVLQEQYESGALDNLLELLAKSGRNLDNDTLKYVEELVDAAVIYTFITCKDYRTALLDVMSLGVPSGIKDSLKELLLTKHGVWVARLYLELEKSMPTDKVLGVFNQSRAIVSAAQILALPENKLNLQDMIDLLMDTPSPNTVLKKIEPLEGKLSSADIKQLLFIAKTYPRLYPQVLLVLHREDVLQYILHEPRKPAYFFESYAEEAKIAVLEQIFQYSDLNRKVLIKNLASPIFLKAAVSLYGTPWFSFVKLRQLALLPSLCACVQSLKDNRVINNVVMHKLFNCASISESLKLDFDSVERLPANYVYIIKSISVCDRPAKTRVSCAKLIQRLYGILRSLEKVYITNDDLAFRNKFVGIQQHIRNNMHDNAISASVFLFKFEEFLTMLDNFASDTQIIASLRPIRVEVELSGRDTLYYLNIRTKTAAVYLRELADISGLLRQDLFVSRDRHLAQVHAVG